MRFRVPPGPSRRQRVMGFEPSQSGCVMGLILLILVILLLVGAIPRWNYSRNWGYAPSGFLGLIVVIVLVLMIVEYVPYGF